MPEDRALITGATSGLGREMAVQLGRRGWRVAVTGRREEQLQETARRVEAAGGRCLPLAGTVTDLEDVRRQYARIREAWGGLDWAVLNAGIGDSEDTRQFSAALYHKIFATNVGGVVNWMEAVLPDMVAARSGVIAGVASLAAYRGLPRSGAYSASKAALVSLLESARVDLRDTGVDIVTVCPGYVKSEITDRNKAGSMPFLLETEDGAARILRGIDARRRVVHFPWQLSLPVLWLLRNLPDPLYDRFAARFGHTRDKKPRRA